MGRYDFRPARVFQVATRLAETGRLAKTPAWHGALETIPPSQILVRTQPTQHRQLSRRRHKRKASKMFMPQQITYEEDALRRQFYGDHPWELARPRTLLETDGKDYQRHDWSSLQQVTRKLDGESVIQRQQWLREHKWMSQEEAYDQARKEFYAARLQQETEMRVAKEEALSTSAYFGKSRVQIGAELEDQSYEAWRRSAQKQYIETEQKRAAAVSSSASSAPAEMPVDHSEGAEDAVTASGKEPSPVSSA